MGLHNFDILCELGSGAFSSVYKVRRHEDNQIYALKKVKLLSLTEKEKQNALNEVRILASIKNTNIIAYKQSFIDHETSTLCLITEYADDGDLQKKIEKLKQDKGSFDEREIWAAFIQMAKALKSLHSINIAHRDLKTANVFLFKNGQVKIGDMNVSKVIKGNLCQTQTGTPYYASPEVWKDVPYDTKSDIWSLGCLIYEMAALDPPFTANNMEGLYKKVLKGIYPKLPSTFSKGFRNLIRMMLQVDPESRPNISLLLDYAQKNQRQEVVQIERKKTQIETTERAIESAKDIGQKYRIPLKKLEQRDNEQDENINLLDTIKLPKKIINIGSKLPKSNYEDTTNQHRQIRKKISVKLLPSVDRSRLTTNFQDQYENYKEKLLKVKSEKLLPLPALASKKNI